MDTPVTPAPQLNPQQLNDLRLRIDAGLEVSNDEILAGLRAIRVDYSTKAANVGSKSSKKVSINVGPIDLKALLAARTVKPSG